MPEPLISVIIPHLNQEEQLARCLQSLEPQRLAHGDVEIIVVDNGSFELPRAAVERFECISLIQEQSPGPGPARNKGVSVSKGKILAFIDADCRADGNWLSVIRNELSQIGSKILIGGDVRIPRENSDHTSFLEAYESIYSYRQRDYIEKRGFSGTGNLAVWREDFDTIGKFLGPHVAEDREWGWRAGKLGYKIRYVPEMVVYHPARDSFKDLLRKWDRHIAHDFETFAVGMVGKSRWMIMSLVMAVSPLLEIPLICRSPRVRGLRERGLAFLGVLGTRLYRTKAMLKLLVTPRLEKPEKSWNRGG